MSSGLRSETGSDVSSRLLRKLERFGEKPGLARIEFLLEALGRPQDAFAAIHVAGTNGKGSTAAMIAAILQSAGLRTGLFTSPHLIRYNERIVVDGHMIADDRLAALLHSIEPHIAAAAADPVVGQPTEFEVATAAALAHFAAERVDVAVIEVGLGGRFDSTNVVQSSVSVITPVGIDHTRVLGTTLHAIAADKAGIVRRGVPVVMARQQPEAADVIRRRAEACAAPLYEAGVDFDGRLTELDVEKTTFSVHWRHAWLHDVHVPLIGRHQVDNAAVAVAAVNVFIEGRSKVHGASRPDPPQVIEENVLVIEDILEGAIRTGLRNVHWPGRFEIIGVRPLTIVDGAHNSLSADALATTLRTVLPDRRVVFVIGMLAEKPAGEILRPLLPFAAGVVFTKPSHGRTAPANPEQLAPLARGVVDYVDVESVPSAAVDRARQIAGPEGIVVICGSLYLVGEVKALPAGKWRISRE